ncbi:hypothetical protein H0A73_22625 [Alcaligenaceae bacterium]|nr:hypothetical protein [Alcaligenaceae bacterium]
MNPSTASHRLVKDLLWNFIVASGLDACCKCGEKMTRNTFSIEHIIPWIDSEDPAGNYFSLGNIAYSHLICNVSDARRNKIYEKKSDAARAWDKKNRVYDPVRRAAQYRRTVK